MHSEETISDYRMKQTEMSCSGNGAAQQRIQELRRDPLVNAFLDAELALCKLMQKICRTLTEGINLDILSYKEETWVIQEIVEKQGFL